MEGKNHTRLKCRFFPGSDPPGAHFPAPKFGQTLKNEAVLFSLQPILENVTEYPSNGRSNYKRKLTKNKDLTVIKREV